MENIIVKINKWLYISEILLYVIHLSLMILAEYYWKDYKKSSIFTIISGIIIVFLHPLILYIHYRNIINIGDDIVDDFTEFGIVLQVFYKIVNFIIPNLLLIQSMINTFSKLACIFTDSYELMFAKYILLMVYIPLYTIIFGLLYHINYDPKILVFVVFYTLYLLLTVVTKYSNNNINIIKKFFEIIFGIITVFVGYYMFLNFEINQSSYGSLYGARQDALLIVSAPQTV